jgi:hypothetical protein
MGIGMMKILRGHSLGVGESGSCDIIMLWVIGDLHQIYLNIHQSETKD